MASEQATILIPDISGYTEFVSKTEIDHSSHVLNHLLENYRNQVIAAMIGLMVGSMRVLWPWPNGTFTTELGAPSGEVLLPIVLALIGATAVIAVEHFSARVGTMPASLE